MINEGNPNDSSSADLDTRAERAPQYNNIYPCISVQMRSEQQPQDRAETEEEATTDASGTEKAQRGDSPQTAAQGKWPPSHEAQAAAAAEGETPAAVEEEAVVSKEADQTEAWGFFGLGARASDEADFYYDEETQTKYHECYCCHIPEMAHNVIKFILFSFNVLFWVISFVLIVIGLWALAVNADYGNALSAVVTSPSLLLILLGILIFLTSFAACVGALRENTYLLKAFIGVMGLGLLLQLVAVILVFTLNSRMQGSLNGFFNRAVKAYNDDIDLRNALDYMQYGLECCGGSGPNDWDSNIYFACDSIAVSKCGVPFSCCRGFGVVHNNTQCGFGIRTGSDGTTVDAALVDVIYTGGCTNRIIVYINENLTTVAVVLVLFFLPQIVSMFLAVTFMGQVQDEIEYWNQKKEYEEKGYYYRYR